MQQHTRVRIAAPVRLRFVLGQRAAEVALPGEVPLVDLLPAVLVELSLDAADRGADHDGWVVQRVGEAPLDEERTAAELDLLDGETLHFRARHEQMPPLDFDDLIDGVGEQARVSPDRWTVARTRWMLLVLGGLLAAAGLVVLGLGGPATASAIVAGALAAALLAAAGLAARAVPDPQTGTLLAGLAAAYAASGAWFVTVSVSPHASLAVRACLALLAVVVTLAAAVALVEDSGLLFAAALTAAAVLAAAALPAAAGGVAPGHAAACGIVGSLVVALLLPPFAFRLGGLALPLLPGKPEQLAEDIDPASHRVVVERGAAGLAYLAALAIGMGAAQTVLGGVLVAPGGRWPLLLALAAAALLLMRSRHLTGTVARWATITPGAALLLFTAVRFAADRPGLLRVAVLVPVGAALAGLVLTLAATLPGRRLRPYWGRAVDIAELLTAVALIPLLGAVLGVYPMIRAWAG